MPIQYSIPTPKSPFVDKGTGLVSREWFLYLNNIFGSVSTFVSSGVTASSGPLSTGQLVIADGPLDIASLTGLTVSSVVVASSSGAISTQPGLGTSTQVLHGNATSFPFYSAVKLTADVSGILPIGNGGTNASSALLNGRMMISSSGSIVEATSLANGQLFIGSSGAGPVASTLTASTGIVITNSPGSIAIAATSAAFNVPQVSTFPNVGTSTYTPPAGILYLEVELVGAGGGGGAQQTNNGTDGAATTFGTAFLTANGGTKGQTAGAAAGTGGTASGGDQNVTGGGGGGANTGGAGGISIPGGIGGSSYFGGAGAAGTSANPGGNAGTNSGSGGGGGGGNAATTGGCGGGAGGYCYKIITSPASSYATSTGAKGTGGAAGGAKGGDGGDGFIIVRAFFQ